MASDQRQLIDEKLKELGIVLPQAPSRAANHELVRVVNSNVYVGAHLPVERGVVAVKGLVGDTVKAEQGVRAARLCLINILGQLEATLDGGLEAITELVRLDGYVAAVPGFASLDQVMDGASDLAISLFGRGGQHVRSVAGVTALPENASVMIGGLFRL